MRMKRLKLRGTWESKSKNRTPRGGMLQPASHIPETEAILNAMFNDSLVH